MNFLGEYSLNLNKGADVFKWLGRLILQKRVSEAVTLKPRETLHSELRSEIPWFETANPIMLAGIDYAVRHGIRRESITGVVVKSVELIEDGGGEV